MNSTKQTIISAEPDGPSVRLTLRCGDAELVASLDPRRAALIAARLNYAISESLLAAQKSAVELIAAQPPRLMRRSIADGIEAADLDAPIIAASLRATVDAIVRAAQKDARHAR